MSDIDDRMEAQEAEYEMGIERELREAEQDGAFTVTEDQEGDRCDSFARELTVALVDMALVQWNDRERCRCVIQQHAARIGELEGERAPLAERIRGIECRHNIATARIAELEAKVGRLEIENHNLRSCMRSCATVAEDDDALQAERAALAERIRGIECRHNISSDRRSEPLRQVFEQGYDAALHAAAALVEQVKQPKGDE
jgi:hypothetical protein